MKKLYWNTVQPLLREVLKDLIMEPIFSRFRLVGGTSLSLQLGHRMSVDIDLFTDAKYGSIDFRGIQRFLENKYCYCSSRNLDNVSFGTFFEIGNSENDFVKLDIYYTDEFIEQPIIIEEIRMATTNEIIAMKLDVILRGGRKKDFWDLHYFVDKVTVDEMTSLFKMRYPYDDNFNKIKDQLINFENADSDFEPICLLQKNWEIIKLDFHEFVIK